MGEEKEAQFNDIENGKNDSDDGTIETIINDDDDDNDNDNDNDEDSIEIINDNTNININNNNNIDRSQTLSPPLDLNRIMDQEVHFDEKENKIILTNPKSKKTTVMVPGRKRLRRSYGRSLQNRPQQLHNGEADDEGKNVNKNNNEKIDESNNDVSSDEELFTSSNATRNRSAVVLDDDDSDDDDQDEHVNAHHLLEDNDDDDKKEDTNNDNPTIGEIDTKVEVENNDGTKTPPSSQPIINDH